MLKNLTPHTITLIRADGTRIVLAPSDRIARLRDELIPSGEIEGLPVYVRRDLKVEGLPEPQRGVIYIVSSLVLGFLNGSRPDCVAVGQRVYDRVTGAILGSRAFIKLPDPDDWNRGEQNQKEDARWIDAIK